MAHNVELLAEYARNKSESAFTAIVERNLPLVFFSSPAAIGGQPAAGRRRGANGFCGPGPKGLLVVAPQISYRLALQKHAFRRGKSAARKKTSTQRESQSATMGEHNENTPVSEEHWMEISAVLDDAMAALAARDREALLLRFYQNRNLKTVGAELGMSV